MYTQSSTTKSLRAVLLATLVAVPLAGAAETPPDRTAIGATPPTSATRENDKRPLELPPAPERAGDLGRTDWATVDAETIRREEHLRKVSAAYGAAGSFMGLGVTSLLISLENPFPGPKKAYRYGAYAAGGLSLAAFVTGTVLWATTPSAPGAPRLALGPQPSLTLVVTLP